jgi:uncharacterized protein YpmS
VRIISNLLMAIGVIAIIILAFLVAGYILFQSIPDIKAQIGEIPVSATAAQSYSEKYAAFEADIETSVAEQVKKEVALTLTDEEVNSKIVELMAEGKFPFEEMLISFRGDVCWIYFVSKTQGVNAKIGMVLRPQIQNGAIRMEVLEFHAGKLPLPQSIEVTAGDIINVLVNMENPANELPVDLTSINVGDKTITIKAMTKPVD